MDFGFTPAFRLREYGRPWTQEEIEDFERRKGEFEEQGENPEHDSRLDWAAIEFKWSKPVPSC